MTLPSGSSAELPVARGGNLDKALVRMSRQVRVTEFIKVSV
jgi:hypothetical protein